MRTMGLAPRNRRRRAMHYCIAAVVSAHISAQFAQADPFYIGGDVSLLPTIEQLNAGNNGPGIGGASLNPFKDGGTLQPDGTYNGGVSRPAEQILVNHGENIFRIRLFVNPSLTYNSTNVGAIQDQNYAIALAQRYKATGAKVILDLHYSDTWADPGHQTISGQWTNHTLSALESTVTTYTQNTLQAFKTAGVMPDIVQVGNETTNGMMWPTGQLNFTGSGTTATNNASWAAYGGLLNAAISGVRAVQGTGPRIPVALSIDKGDKDGQPQFHFGRIQMPVINGTGTGGGGVTDFDIEGVDFYSSSTTGITTMTNNLTTLANYKFQRRKPQSHLPSNPAEKDHGFGNQLPVGDQRQLHRLVEQNTRRAAAGIHRRSQYGLESAPQ